MSKPPVVPLLPGLAAAWLAAGCLQGGTAAPGAQTGTPAPGTPGSGVAATVEIVNFTFSPNPVKVRKGQSVRFMNRDTVPHSVTIGSFKAEDNVNAGQEKVVRFDTVGRIPYVCQYHPNMQATVEVEE